MGQAGTSDDQVTSEQGTRISVGQELRRAREVRHVTLAQLSAETRIALRHLEALEEDRFDDLPGRLYARNFVRQVAASLGADEQELLDYFDYQSGEVARRAGRGEEALVRQSARRRLAFGALAVAALIIAGALGFALTRGEGAGEPAPEPARGSGGSAFGDLPAGEPPAAGSGEVDAVAATSGSRPAETAGRAKPAGAGGAEPTPEAAQAAPAATETEQPEPVAATPVGAAAREPEPDPEPVVVEAAPEPPPVTPAQPGPPSVRLAFKGPSWIEVVLEGSGKQIMGLKTAGEEVSFPLSSPVELTVNNAGNVELFIDGRPARALGAPGERRTLRLDADSWQSYLR